ncbi:MAG: DinB family protein [Polyangiaceae bacterium]
MTKNVNATKEHSSKSIHGTFNHLLAADKIWLSRFRDEPVLDGFMGPGIRSLDQELHSNFDELRGERARIDAELEGWASELTEDRLMAPFAYRRGGRRQTEPLWWAVAHVFNHQTHHRGQITTLLSQTGHDPGVTDLVAMLREEVA